jgi:L-proline amide hydrolase
MSAEKATDVYRAMQGPNEWTTTGALKGWDTRNRLHEITMPTLVVRGRYDMCTEPIAAELVNGIPNAREVVLEHSSHTPVLEESDRYLEVVGDFLREAEMVLRGRLSNLPDPLAEALQVLEPGDEAVR